MEASTKQMQNNLKNLEKEKQKAQIEEDDLARQYEALKKKNDQLEDVFAISFRRYSRYSSIEYQNYSILSKTVRLRK